MENKKIEKSLYYTAPADPLFEEMKRVCIEVWGQYADSAGGYMQEKVERIEGMGNIQDNFMYMLGMFDHINQRKVVERLSVEAKEAVRDRLIAGGNDEGFINLIGL